MKGFRTFVVAFLMAMAPTALTYFSNFDWPGFLASVGVPHQWQIPLAGLLGGIVMGGLRALTNTPPGNGARDA